MPSPPTITTLAIRAITLATIASAAFSSSAQAQTETDKGNWSGFISVGPGVTPEFDGSSRYTFVPFIAADIKYKSVSLEFRGLGARLDVLSGLGSGMFYGGPAINFKMARDNKKGKVGDPVRFLDKIDFETQGGGFVGAKFGGDENGAGQFKMEVTALTGANGFQSTGLVSYALVRNEQIFIDVNSNLTYANKKFMRTYFGVTPAEALRSRLAAYTPGSGIRDVGAGVTLGYQFSQRWNVITNVNYNYLVGDAGKSPIVKGRLTGTTAEKAKGSRSQLVAGIGIGWSF